MDETADPIRVLHVDDDRTFGELTARYLQREDDRLEITTVTDVEAGLGVFDSEPIDGVVSDYDMPGEDGLAFLEAVRERNQEVPFVLFTGQGDEAVASEAISAGVTDYLQKGTSTDQYAILANRITNAVAAYRTQQRADRHERISTLLRRVNRRLVDAVTVLGIEWSVCEVIAEAEPYRLAWIGEPDPETGEVVPRAAAGDGADYLREVSIYHDDRPCGWGPTGMAVRTREIQLVRNVQTDPSFDPWRATVSAYDFGSVVVLPLFRGDALHGVLEIYADAQNAFTEVERAVLAELAETVSRALEAVQVRRRLRTRERADVDTTERHYRAIAEGLPNGSVALFDTDLRYNIVGGAVFEELDISVTDLEGKPLSEAHSASFRERHLHHYRAALAGERRTFEFEYAGRIFRAHVVPVRDTRGTVAAGLALTQEVTEERERERALERQSERLDAFAGVVAHDLGNPLDVAAGRLELARQEFESEQLDAVERAHDRMRTLIGELLSLAREARPATDTEPVDLTAAMAEAWRNVETNGAQPVIATNRVIRADRTRLQQLLENLVRNSVEHGSTSPRSKTHEDAVEHGSTNPHSQAREDSAERSSAGSRTQSDDAVEHSSTGNRASPDDALEHGARRASARAVREESAERSSTGNRGVAGDGTTNGVGDVTVRLDTFEGGFYVEDDGPGIPPGRREAVFEPGHSTAPDGTGFGLNIVERIAEAHGWSISVTEGADGGTRVEFTGVEFER